MKITEEYSSFENFFDNTDSKTRELVFYSEKAIYYNYFESFIDYILNNSDLEFCYVSSDPEDPIFRDRNSRIKVFYINKLLVTFMSRIDSKLVVMTMPDLNQFHIKRSKTSNAINYLYIFHAIVSSHMVYRKGAFDYYDTIFCVGPHHLEEIRKTESLYQLDSKKLVNVGYPIVRKFYDDHQKYLKEFSGSSDRKKCVLVAPSWGKKNIIEICIKDLAYSLASSGYRIIIRPHPHFINTKKRAISKLQQEFKNKNDIELELDLSSYNSMHAADVLITDWSGIAFEYAFGTERPVLFIDTPMKINNPEYDRLGIEPLEVKARNCIGTSIGIKDIDKADTVVAELIEKKPEYKQNLKEYREKCIFNWDAASKVGGQYIIEFLS